MLVEQYNLTRRPRVLDDECSRDEGLADALLVSEDAAEEAVRGSGRFTREHEVYTLLLEVEQRCDEAMRLLRFR